MKCPNKIRHSFWVLNDLCFLSMLPALFHLTKQRYDRTSYASSHVCVVIQTGMHLHTYSVCCLQTTSVSYSFCNYRLSLNGTEKMNEATFSKQYMQQRTSQFEKLAYKVLQFIKGILLPHNRPIHHSELCPFLCDFVKITCLLPWMAGTTCRYTRGSQCYSFISASECGTDTALG